MKIGIVQEADPNTCRCRVLFDDHDGVVSYWLPVLQKKTGRDKSYWLPDPGEHVCCLMDEHAEDGCVMGAMYSDADTTPVADQDKQHTLYEDGTIIEYDRRTHTLTADVKGDAHVTTTGSILARAHGDADVRCQGRGFFVGDGPVLVESRTKLTLRGPRGVIIL